MAKKVSQDGRMLNDQLKHQYLHSTPLNNCCTTGRPPPPPPPLLAWHLPPGTSHALRQKRRGFLCPPQPSSPSPLLSLEDVWDRAVASLHYDLQMEFPGLPGLRLRHLLFPEALGSGPEHLWAKWVPVASRGVLMQILFSPYFYNLR